MNIKKAKASAKLVSGVNYVKFEVKTMIPFKFSRPFS